MNYQTKLSVIAALCISATPAMYAETKTFNVPSDWQQEKLLTPNGKTAMKTEMSTTILSKEMLTLDMKKQYFLSGSIKAAEGSPKGRLYFGFRIYDNKGVMLQCHHCQTVNGTDTELAESTEPTDTSIVVKNASKWQLHPHITIAFNTKPDQSDLPNRNIISVCPKKIEKSKDGWVIHLDRPVNMVLPAGTKIREHRRGGEFYYGIGNDKKPVLLKKSRIWWWKGISKVRMLVNATCTERGKKMKLDLSGLEVEIREKK